jgi:DNA-directed RNA polymerase II subunit RPB2
MALSKSREHIDWAVINKFFNETPFYFTKHHIDSYHEFVFEGIPYVLSTLNPIQVLKKVEGGNDIQYEINVYIGGKAGDELFLAKPTIVEDGKQRVLFPNEARLKNLSYVSDLYVDVTVEYVLHMERDSSGAPKVVQQTYEKVKIGSIPILLHSRLCALYEQPPLVLKEMGECIFDQGGYYIIDGKEKVIIAQERMVTNRLFANNPSSPSFPMKP